MAEDAIRACPECGIPVEHHCFHDGEEVRSVEMPEGRAAELRYEAATELLDRVAGLGAHGFGGRASPRAPQLAVLFEAFDAGFFVGKENHFFGLTEDELRAEFDRWVDDVPGLKRLRDEAPADSLLHAFGDAEMALIADGRLADLADRMAEQHEVASEISTRIFAGVAHLFGAPHADDAEEQVHLLGVPRSERFTGEPHPPELYPGLYDYQPPPYFAADELREWLNGLRDAMNRDGHAEEADGVQAVLDRLPAESE